MKWDQLLSTWFGAGLLRPAPGTWGSLAALPLGFLLLWWKGWPALAVGAITVTALGIWASGAYTKRLAKDDPGEVVIDEVAGQWLALLPLAFDWRLFVLAFIAFRFFDIMKPWPVGWLDRHLNGSLGIMADDLAAGVLAGASVGLAGWLIWGLPCFP